MERQLSRNPTTVEVRVHCLDMAVRSAQLMGRADSLLQIAEQYFEWCTRGAQPVEGARPVDPPQAGDDAGPIGGGGDGIDGNDGSHGNEGGEGSKGPASLRQGGKK